MRRTFRGFCGALLLAASVGALNVGAAFAQDLDALSSRILDNPGDVSLNLQYAHAAEAAGKPRLALAAYERILINDPGNEEARQGYERVRRIIEPAYTTTRIELGARWDSDPLNVRNGNEATTYFVNASMVDERAFGSMRWRTILNGEADYTPDIDLLNYAYAGVQTGPIVFMSPHIAMLPAIGGGIASLDGDLYFADVNLSLTFEGRGAGFSYWTRARGGWRDYGDTSIAQSGSYAELV
ncbi:MAG: hypothetical protein JSS00_07905, partial [Proteobacteria bacterium]|nr:hypothetical protein [Pseudomonadota bacterium]